MRTSEKQVRLRKAGALVACTAFLGSSAPALANGWGGNVSVAANIPLGHLPTPPTHTLAGHSGSNGGSWSAPGSGAGNAGGQKPSHGIPFFGNHFFNAGSTQNNQWHAQQFLSTLPPRGGAALQSLFSGSNAGGTSSGPGLELDLTSTTPSIVLGTSIFQGKQSVSVEIGGTHEAFAPGAHVTAAEYVAIRQVLGGKDQTLTLSSQGSAVGGSFSLNAVSSSPIGELVVPSGVTALDYASKGNTQNIAGDVLNYGTIYGVAARGQGTTVSLNAQDIINESGGLISTSLSRSLASSVGGVMSPVSLSLAAGDDISNSGKIVSSGSLSLTATNGSISNGTVVVGGPVKANILAPSIAAVHDITMSTGTGNVTNGGLIVSSTGSISVSTPNAGNDINISAAGGTFQALKGDISIRDASYAGSSNINLNGGNYLSQNFNLYSGTGTINGNIGEVTGKVNTEAGADHLEVATPTLLLGNNLVSGDPTFVNSGSVDGGAGNIEIVGTNTFGEDVAIIAAGNITASATGQIVANGKNVTLVAGANITTSTSTDDNGTVQNNTGSSPYPGSAQNPVTVTATQGSALGGSIDLTGSKAINVINTSGTTGTGGTAGNVTLVAFADSTTQTSGGTVTLANNSLINAAGSGSGGGGNVTIIAGSNPSFGQNAIQVGAISTGGGAAGGQGGSISLYSAPPTTNDGKGITFDATGKITTGNTFEPGAVNANGQIVADGDLVTSAFGQNGVIAGSAGAAAGAITISAGGNISTQNLLAFGGGGAGGDSVSFNGGAGGKGASITVSSTSGSIVINGQVNSSGGGGGGAGSDGVSSGTGGAGGTAGPISLSQGVTSSPGITLLQIGGGVFAADGGFGGNSTTTYVGGGGGSYGGGGGGGSSGTGGTLGKTGTTVGTIGGGAGGAGFFGGGGGDVDGAGGGGGYTGGSAGGSQVNATTGTASTGGFGAAATGLIAPAGGQLGSSQQGGQGSIIGSGNGENIHITSGGADVTLSTVGTATIGGDIAGQNVTLTSQGNLTLQGNVFGTASVVINDGLGSLLFAAPGLAIMTPTLNVNLGSTGVFLVGIEGSPIVTSATIINITGSANATNITDTATSLSFNEGTTGQDEILSINMTNSGAILDVAQLPTTIYSLTLSAASGINLGQSTFQVGQAAINDGQAGSLGSVSLTTGLLTWLNSGANPLKIDASNTNGNGGTISISLTGNSAIGIGNSGGNFNLNASGGGTTADGGSVTLIAASANLTVDGGFLQVSPGSSGKGGGIVLNVLTIASANSNALVLNASGTGTGSGGTISVTTNGNSPQTIGTASGEINLIATNGTTAGIGQIGGKVSFLNLGGGTLTLDQSDPTTLQTEASAGAANVGGGTITLTAGSIVGSAGAAINLNVDALLGGTGGSISITETSAVGTVILGSGGTGNQQFLLSAQGGSQGGNGGSITLSTTGALQFSTDPNGNVIGSSASGAAVAIGPQAMNGAGGGLTLSATSFSNLNPAATTPLIFNASGQGTGNGGRLRLTQLDADSNLTIGAGTGDIEMIATNGALGTLSGTAIITIANNATNDGKGILTVDPSAIVLSQSTKSNPNVRGGFIELNAPTIASTSLPAKGPLVLNVSGTGTQDGGDIIFEESNADSSPVIGTKVGQFEFLAADGSKGLFGGAVIVASGGNLTVNTAGINVKASGNGSGGDVSLSALNVGNGAGVLPGEGNLIVIGSLNVNAAGKGTGGTIGLVSNSTNAFNIGSTHNNPNGVEGSLSLTGGNGGNLSIGSSGSGGIVIQTALTSPQFVTITFATTATGDVDINAAVGGTKTNSIIIAPTGANTTTVDNIIGGSTGKLVTSSTGSITLAALTDIRGAITTTKTGTTTKQLQMVTETLTANDGGDIDINDAISVSSTLTINGMTAGDSINLSSGGSINTLNGMSAVNLINLFCEGSLSTGLSMSGFNSPLSKGFANLSSTTNVISLSPNELKALIVEVKLQLKGTSFSKVYEMLCKTYGETIAGKVAIAVNGSSNGNAMVFNANATAASLPTSGPFSTFSMITEGSGLFALTGNTSMVLSGTFGTSSSAVSIQSTAIGGTITGAATGFVLTGKTVSLQSNGGDIGALGNGIQVNTPNLTANTGGAGNAYINSVGKTTLAMTDSTAASFNLTSSGGVNISNVTTTSGDINLTTKGPSIVNGLNSAGMINISDTVGLLTISSSAASNNVIVASTGGANISGLTSSQGGISITTNATTKVGTSQSAGDFTIDETKGSLAVTTVSSANSSGSVNITGAGGATVTDVSNEGDISINGGSKTIANNVASSAAGVTIVSPGAATLTGVTAATMISVTDSSTTTATTLNATNGPINIKSAGIGTVSLSGLTTSNGDITISTGGVTNLAGLSAVGAIIATTGGATTVGSMSATGIAGDGNISVTNSTGLLQTSAGAKVYAQNGSILFQNDNAKSGAIVIGTGSDIETGTQPTPGVGGNITLTIGNIVTPVTGTPPLATLVTPTTSAGGVIFWGTNGISATLSKGVGNAVTAKGADVIFNTGSLKGTAIKLSGNTTIVADPPANSIGYDTSAPQPAGTLPSQVGTHQPSSLTTGPNASLPMSSTLGQTEASVEASALMPTPNVMSPPAQNSPNTIQFAPALLEASSLMPVVLCLPCAMAPPAGATVNHLGPEDSETRWISETEIESGLIPAVFSSGGHLGIHSDTSSILEAMDCSPKQNPDYTHAGITSGEDVWALSCSSLERSTGREKVLTGGVNYARHSTAKYLNLTRGSVVFAPTQETTIETPFATITVAAKALVLIMAIREGVAVYDFNDTHPSAVTVVACGKSFALAPGHHLFISTSIEKEFGLLNPAQMFTYRYVRQQTLVNRGIDKALYAFTAEFNIPRAIRTVIPLSRLIASHNQSAKKIADSLLKTSAIISELTANGDQFQQVLRPSIISMR